MFWCLYSMRTMTETRLRMKEETVKRDYYWVVEASDPNGQISYRKEYHNKDGSALRDYARLKATGAVSIQRKFKEYKIA
jgi:hypothetical protein